MRPGPAAWWRSYRDCSVTAASGSGYCHASGGNAA